MKIILMMIMILPQDDVPSACHLPPTQRLLPAPGCWVLHRIVSTVEPRYSVHHWGNGKCMLYQSVCYIKVLHKVNKKSGFNPGDGVIQLTNGCV